MRSISFLIVFFVCLSLFTQAETFVVTNNADNGTGTLREALLQSAANGNTETDLIQFNIAGSNLADLIIILKTQLPDITSNVVIDGSTQPTAKFGISGAKIGIQPGTGNDFSILTINKAGIKVEIYGLMITKTFQTNIYNKMGYAINIVTKSEVIVGAPGKGNVLGGFAAGVFGSIGDGKIQSNFIGLMDDGITPIFNTHGVLGRQNYDYLDNALIGGELKEQGNLITSAERGISFMTPYVGITNQTISIINNSFGTDYTETKTIGTSFLYFSHIYAMQGINIIIKKNVFSANPTAMDFLNQVNATVTGNYFGTNRLQNVKLGSNNNYALSGNSMVKFYIGGENAADQNVFTNYRNPISLLNASSAKVIKNTFYCNQQNYITIPDQPVFKILGFMPTKVSGIAPAGAMVQIYDTENTCGNCNPVERFATVYANGSGVWEYNGTIKGPIMASATTGDVTLGFEPFQIRENEVKITHKDCNQLGSIELITKRTGDFTFTWKDKDGNILGQDQKIEGLEPGAYTLEYKMIGGCIFTSRFTILNLLPFAYDTNLTIECGKNTITINGTFNSPLNRAAKQFFWEDKDGVLFANTQLVTLTPGKYFFYMQDASNCFSNKAEVNIKPAPLSPVLDISGLKTNSSNCNESTGFITGIKVTGGSNVSYHWANEQLSYFRSTLDLIDIPAGRYQLIINSSCGEIKSETIPIGDNNPISIDETTAKINPAKCSEDNGSITDITIVGSGVTYTWTDENGNTVGTEKELKLMGAGKYKLRVSKGPCYKETSYISIPQQVLQQFPNYPALVKNASCNLDNGSIEVDFSNNIMPTAIRWTNADNQNIGNSNKLTDLPPGAYKLYLTDNGGCESFYKSYTVDKIPPTIVDVEPINIKHDQCGMGVGAITNISVTTQNSVTYLWRNESGEIAGKEKDLKNVKTGKYTLVISDGFCNIYTTAFFIPDEVNQPEAPIVAHVNICAAGKAIIAVTNAKTGKYNLYKDEFTNVPVATNFTGIFSVEASKNETFYVSFSNGNCESLRTAAGVTIADKSLWVPKSFTPNGDGVNDTWIISGINNYPEASIKIYNRNGNIVFSALANDGPFNGYKSGTLLPVGVYYYFIELRKGCNILNGSLTLIR